MKARVGLAVTLAVGVLVGFWGLPLWWGPPMDAAPPHDNAGTDFLLFVDHQPSSPLSLVVFGTSLSSQHYDWPEAVAQVLSGCLERDVIVTRITRPGAISPGPPINWNLCARPTPI